MPDEIKFDAELITWEPTCQESFSLTMRVYDKRDSHALLSGIDYVRVTLEPDDPAFQRLYILVYHTKDNPALGCTFVTGTKVEVEAMMSSLARFPSMEILYVGRRNMLGYEITKPVATIFDEDSHA